MVASLRPSDAEDEEEDVVLPLRADNGAILHDTLDTTITEKSRCAGRAWMNQSTGRTIGCMRRDGDSLGAQQCSEQDPVMRRYLVVKEKVLRGQKEEGTLMGSPPRRRRSEDLLAVVHFPTYLFAQNGARIAVFGRE